MPPSLTQLFLFMHLVTAVPSESRHGCPNIPRRPVSCFSSSCSLVIAHLLSWRFDITWTSSMTTTLPTQIRHYLDGHTGTKVRNTCDMLPSRLLHAEHHTQHACDSTSHMGLHHDIGSVPHLQTPRPVDLEIKKAS
jgi:hypothetical protein